MRTLNLEQLETRETPSAPAGDLLPGYSQETQDFLRAHGFVGTVNALAADLTGDGHPETVVWGDAGNGPALLVFDGGPVELLDPDDATPDQLPAILYDGFVPVFDPQTWRGGLEVNAVGQNFVAGLPYRPAKLVVTAPDDSGGGPVASIFRFEGGGWSVENRFILGDPNFCGGVRLASLDVDGDGTQELLVTAAGLGAGPRLEVFDLSGPTARSIHNVFIAHRDDRSGEHRVVDIAIPAGGRRVLVIDRGTDPAPAVYYDTGEPYQDPFAGEFDSVG